MAIAATIASRAKRSPNTTRAAIKDLVTTDRIITVTINVQVITQVTSDPVTQATTITQATSDPVTQATTITQAITDPATLEITTTQAITDPATQVHLPHLPEDREILIVLVTAMELVCHVLAIMDITATRTGIHYRPHLPDRSIFTTIIMYVHHFSDLLSALCLISA